MQNSTEFDKILRLIDSVTKEQSFEANEAARLAYQIERQGGLSESQHARYVEAPLDTEIRMPDDREYVNLKLEAAEARTETRFAELNGKLDRLIDSVEASRSSLREQLLATQLDISKVQAEARADARSTRNTIYATVIGAVLALAALLMGVVTYGDAIFSRGMSVRDVVNAISKEQSEKASKPDLGSSR